MDKKKYKPTPTIFTHKKPKNIFWFQRPQPYIEKKKKENPKILF
jgi:hypothetical protein